jgi:hypothetical protein
MPQRAPSIEAGSFVIAKNPDADSKLPYLLRVPIDGETWLKARETWPRSTRVYCHPAARPPDISALQILESVPVESCTRRGPAVDIILARGVNRRAQFITTRFKGRSMIFWQTARAATSARPGLRVAFSPKQPSDVVLLVDTRERYPYRFAGGASDAVRAALPVGDYGVRVRDEFVAAVERKTIDDLCKGLSEGSVGYAMAHLATLRAAALVVEGTYSKLLRAPLGRGAWFADLIARLQVRYPSVPIVFAESRKLAEEWTRRFLLAAAGEFATPALPLAGSAKDPDPVGSAKKFIRKSRRAKGLEE